LPTIQINKTAFYPAPQKTLGMGGFGLFGVGF
jgi:hypothetical protein